MPETLTAVRERPIIFTAESVRGLLAGTKTQTRRVLKPQPEFDGINWQWWTKGFDDITFDPRYTDYGYQCPYGMTGDRLWVKETWKQGTDDVVVNDTGTVRTVFRNPDPGLRPVKTLYRADFYGMDHLMHKPWRSPLFMPRWASRLTLEIVDVWVEKLRSISEEEAKAEGAVYTDWGRSDPFGVSMDGGRTYQQFTQDLPGWHFGDARSHEQCHSFARHAFASLWDSINGRRPGCAWQDDPFVWVIEFRRCQP